MGCISLVTGVLPPPPPPPRPSDSLHFWRAACLPLTALRFLAPCAEPCWLWLPSYLSQFNHDEFQTQPPPTVFLNSTRWFRNKAGALQKEQAAQFGRLFPLEMGTRAEAGKGSLGSSKRGRRHLTQIKGTSWALPDRSREIGDLQELWAKIPAWTHLSHALLMNATST